jgi:serine/threonine-protein kinase
MARGTSFGLRALDAGALAQTVQQYGGAVAHDATLGRGRERCESRAEPLTEVRLGVDLEVLGVLGEGGMGVVHLARHRSLEREVAMKTVRAGAPSDVLLALSKEAVLTGSLEHPGIVPVHAFGHAPDGRPVMVMKRVEGVPWRELLRAPDHPHWGTIGSSDRLVDHLTILMQVANALWFAHSRGVVHRDVKPENVMVGEFGEVCLVDFGIAVRTRDVADAAVPIAGTPSYMAPEMVAGGPIDARTDVYLLGATLFEILRGQPPHRGANLHQVLLAAYEAQLLPFGDDIPQELAAVCQKALARQPTQRFASAREFRTALADFLNHRGSIRLASRAEALLRDAASASLDDHQTRLRRRILLTECRFAYHQALAEWPDNAAARSGAVRCLEAMIQLEIEEGHASAARALLGDLLPNSSALLGELDALECRIEAERAASQQLRLFAQDMDPWLGHRTRRRAVLWFAGFAALLSVAALQATTAGELSAERVVQVGIVNVVVVGAIAGALWRRLSRNAFGRKLTTAVVTMSLFMLVQRLMAARTGLPAHVTLTIDSLQLTLALIMGGIALAPFLLRGAALTGLGFALQVLWPGHAPTIFSISTVAMLLVLGMFWRPPSES